MYNRIILMGRLTADPELKQTPSGVAMCKFSVAVERRAAAAKASSNAPDGAKSDEKLTDFFNVTCWRGTAEFVSKYFSKGRMIHLEGRLENNNYTDQNGVKHYAVNITADNVSFCGDKPQTSQPEQGFQQAVPQPAAQPYPTPQSYPAPPQYQPQGAAPQGYPAPPPSYTGQPYSPTSPQALEGNPTAVAHRQQAPVGYNPADFGEGVPWG